MNENLLDSNTQAALGGLIALAGALGIGALLAQQFFDRAGRRDRNVRVAVFEVFAVVTILTTSGMTAFFSLFLLQSGEAVSDSEFTEAATPLIIAAVLLVVLVALARFAGLHGGLGEHLPTSVATIFFAVVIASVLAFLAIPVEHIATAVAAVLLLGLATAQGFAFLERRTMNGTEKGMRERLATLSASGYDPLAAAVRPALPQDSHATPNLELICWMKKGKTYLDPVACFRLRDEVSQRWDRLMKAELLPPAGQVSLARVEIKTKVFPWPPRLRLSVQTYSRGEPGFATQVVEAEENGLIDITELNLVQVP